MQTIVRQHESIDGETGMECIREQVKWFITHHVLSEEDADTVTDGTNLRESGILSSLWIVRLVSFIEERFHVTFDAIDLYEDNFSSIRDIERLIQSKVSAVS
jgi:methoxymalonate biosynthesis acyl carrier protein